MRGPGEDHIQGPGVPLDAWVCLSQRHGHEIPYMAGRPPGLAARA